VDGEFLERWLEEVVAAPGLTSLTAGDARRVLLDDALRAAPFIEQTRGSVIDVGSGGGSPGVPLAAVLPALGFTLLEADRRKARFLERITAVLPNVRVLWGRAEEQPVDVFDVALAKALAKPPVATELCLPLVKPGGIALLWVGETASVASIELATEQLGGTLEDDAGGILVLRKVGPTPNGFPRRPGMAKKRPLA
jgi:16S rRNA (guanine527-N7)-methyltransferase